MAHLKFTDTVIRNLPLPEKDRLIYWAEGQSGLGIRCGAKSKTFIGKIDFKGRDRVVTYGRYPAMTIAEAKQEHLNKLLLAQKGVDPAVNADGGKSIEQWGVDYFNDRKKNGFKDVANQEGIFKKDIVPVIGRLPPADVTSALLRKTIDKTLTRIQKENPEREGAGLSHIRHLQVVIRGFFKWLNNKGELSSNPARDLETVGVARERERVLTPVELWKFWNRIDSGGLEVKTVGALRMMLATMQRGKEVRSLKWSDIEGDSVWNLSSSDVKNKKFHRVPLNDMAKAIIKAARPPKYKKNDSDIYVFGGASPISDRALAKALLRERNRIDVEDIQPHDLRRTAATLVTAVGLPSLYASLLLNHSRQGVTNRVYVQYSYDPEKIKVAAVLNVVLSEIINAKDEKSVPNIDKLRAVILKKGII